MLGKSGLEPGPCLGTRVCVCFCVREVKSSRVTHEGRGQGRGPRSWPLRDLHQKQPVLCSFSGNILPPLILSHSLPPNQPSSGHAGTSWAAVKEAEKPSPKASSPWREPALKVSCPRYPHGPSLPGTPQLPEPVTCGRCHQPDDSHLPVCRARWGGARHPRGLLPQGGGERQALVLLSCGSLDLPGDAQAGPEAQGASPAGRGVGASEPPWTAEEAEPEPEPDQTQRIWGTLSKPHSPEAIGLTNSSARDGFHLLRKPRRTDTRRQGPEGRGRDASTGNYQTGIRSAFC